MGNASSVIWAPSGERAAEPEAAEVGVAQLRIAGKAAEEGDR
jgi:hypothetical protein